MDYDAFFGWLVAAWTLGHAFSMVLFLSTLRWLNRPKRKK